MSLKEGSGPTLSAWTLKEGNVNVIYGLFMDLFLPLAAANANSLANEDDVHQRFRSVTQTTCS